MPTYSELKQLIQAKAIHSFADFFLFIPQNKFMEDTGISRRRLQALIASPGHMSMDEMWAISQLIGVSFEELGMIIKADYIRSSQ